MKAARERGDKANLKYDKLVITPRGGQRQSLILAHLNICSLRNKVHEIITICSSNNIHVLALTETHLDTTFNDSELAVHGYRLYRRDRDRYGGGVASYVQEHIPVVMREDIACTDMEIIWLQIRPSIYSIF